MDPFEELERQMRKLMETMMGGSRVEIFTPMAARGAGGGMEGFREPLVDVRDEDERITVTAEVPGVEKEDIKLRVRQDGLGNHVLVMSARRKEESEKKDKGTYASGFRSMSFRKEVTLPGRVKKETAKADYHNGVLEVTFERAEPREEEEGTDIPIK